MSFKPSLAKLRQKAKVVPTTCGVFILHDHPCYHVCPDMLSLGRWYSFGKRVWFTKSNVDVDISFCLFTDFVLNVSQEQIIFYSINMVICTFSHRARRRLLSSLNCQSLLSAASRYLV